MLYVIYGVAGPSPGGGKPRYYWFYRVFSMFASSAFVVNICAFGLLVVSFAVDWYRPDMFGLAFALYVLAALLGLFATSCTAVLCLPVSVLASGPAALLRSIPIGILTLSLGLYSLFGWAWLTPLGWSVVIWLFATIAQVSALSLYRKYAKDIVTYPPADPPVAPPVLPSYPTYSVAPYYSESTYADYLPAPYPAPVSQYLGDYPRRTMERDRLLSLTQWQLAVTIAGTAITVIGTIVQILLLVR